MRILKTLLFAFLLGLTPPRYKRSFVLWAQNVWIPWRGPSGRYMLWLGDRTKERKWRENFLV